MGHHSVEVLLANGFRPAMNLGVLSISLVLGLKDETVRVSWFTLCIFSPLTCLLPLGFGSLPDNAEPQFRFVLLAVQQKDGQQSQ